jgi:predicted negative regulator of RcsB-dependent stress response
MANFFSASQEEQQEILLSFWQKYRYLLIASLLVIASAIIGRDYLQTSSFEEDLNSATEYQEYIEAETDQKALGEKILQSYPESIYSDFVRLNEAKRNYNDGDFNAAIDLLIYILDSKSMSPDEFDPIIAAAQTRLAKIYIEQQNFNEVISIFESKSAMTSSMHELKGDAHNGLGQFSLARESFMLALQNSTNQTARALINMKISDLESEEVE